MTGLGDIPCGLLQVEVVSARSEHQIEVPQQRYQHERWAERRELSGFEKMLGEAEALIGRVDPPTGDHIAFARVLTEPSTRR